MFWMSSWNNYRIPPSVANWLKMTITLTLNLTLTNYNPTKLNPNPTLGLKSKVDIAEGGIYSSRE